MPSNVIRYHFTRKRDLRQPMSYLPICLNLDIQLSTQQYRRYDARVPGLTIKTGMTMDLDVILSSHSITPLCSRIWTCKISTHLAFGILVLVASASYALPSSNKRSEINWSPCPADLGLAKRMGCSTYPVPIDWNNKDGEHFDLVLTRLPATKPSERIGNLYVSPGGPGFSSSFFLAALVALQESQYNYKGNDDVQAFFDVIGIDERGIALSNQVKCDMSIYTEPVSLWPKSESEYQKLVDKNRRFGESCLEGTGPLLGFLDTKR